MEKNIVQPEKILFMSISRWVSKTKNTHCRDVQYLLLSRCYSSWKNAPQCYVYTYIECLVSHWNILVIIR